MSSHFCSFLIKCPFEKIFELLNMKYGTVYNKQLGKLDELRSGVILGEAFFEGGFLTDPSEAAISIFLEELSPIDTQIEIIAYAGAVGLASFSGPQSKLVYYVIDYLKEQGFELESFKEDRHFKGK